MSEPPDLFLLAVLPRGAHLPDVSALVPVFRETGVARIERAPAASSRSECYRLVDETGTERATCNLGIHGGRSYVHVQVPAACVVELGSRELMDVLAGITRALRPDLARTHDSTFATALGPDEWVGTVTALDWFQYFGPALASAWPRSYLERGPFARVEMDRDGGVGVFLAERPGGQLPRQAAADYLGIRLRPLMARHPATGDPIVIPWG
jgi:hypothetical protein